MYRKLKESEIQQLKSKGCKATDWQEIEVHEKFDTKFIEQIKFSGKVKLGYFDKKIERFGGIEVSTGIKNARLHNCEIGNNVYIEGVQEYIANYNIGDNVIIENVELIASEKESTFGNGTIVEPLNESGGRSFPIFDKLSSQLAYILTLFRHNKSLIEKIENLILDYADKYKGKKAKIGKNSEILNTGRIKNVWIGEAACISGVHKLARGNVNSIEDSPVNIGDGVIAENFIISSGSEVKNGVILENTFVGQSVKMGQQFSAENSVFFANCQGYHGEASAIFAGPFTVSHHKSTLLIAGMFSFCNAGSGSNQSNHMYKLGPNHQGVVERGSKTASDSYMLYPMKVGPFSLIMGRHYQNSDTSNLPFSYLFEGDNESILIPGVNLTSVGTIRDAMKWPNRDGRKSDSNLDLINFYLLSPFTVQKMINGKNILKDLKETAGLTSDNFYYNNVRIRRSSLEKGIKYYDMGIKKYIGNCIISRLDGFDFNSKENFYKLLTPDSEVGQKNWVDVSGMLAPEECITEMVNKIESGELSDLSSINNEFRTIHDNFLTYEWNWAADRIEIMKGKKVAEISINEIIEIMEEWRDKVIELDNILKEDAKKEFSRKSQVGYGYNGNEEVREKDFANVIGEFDSNQFVQMINDHIKRKKKKAKEIITNLNKLK